MGLETGSMDETERYVEHVLKLTSQVDKYLVIEKEEDFYDEKFIDSEDGNLFEDEKYGAANVKQISSILKHSDSLEKIYLDVKEENGDYVVRKYLEYKEDVGTVLL